MSFKRFQILTLPIATASLVLAACGGSDSTSSSGSDREKFREAALEFAECMRRNGVDMPDPTPDGGMRLTARPGDEATVQRAQEACQKYLDKARPPEPSEEEQREAREQALEHARCMREHGIDFPDPTFGEDGTVEQRLGEGIDPKDPAFREAEKACGIGGLPVEEDS
jgi:hypothetical protein